MGLIVPLVHIVHAHVYQFEHYVHTFPMIQPTGRSHEDKSSKNFKAVNISVSLTLKLHRGQLKRPIFIQLLQQRLH
jgi:hypothetical protein